MRDRSYVLDGFNFETCGLQCTDCGFTASTRALDEDFDSLQAMFHSGFGSRFSSHLSCEGSALTGTAEAHAACGCPAEDCTGRIGNRYDGVIKGGTNMCHTSFNVFLLTFRLLRTTFLPATRLIPSLRLFLLAANVLGAFASTGVVLGVLTTNRQTCSVATATIAANFHQTLDVQGIPHGGGHLLLYIRDPGAHEALRFQLPSGHGHGYPG